MPGSRGSAEFTRSRLPPGTSHGTGTLGVGGEWRDVPLRTTRGLALSSSGRKRVFEPKRCAIHDHMRVDIRRHDFHIPPGIAILGRQTSYGRFPGSWIRGSGRTVPTD